MYNRVKQAPHTINCGNNVRTEAKSIEQKMRAMMSNKEPIMADTPMIYTERKDGVHAGYDIRTDRFDVALDAQNRVEAAKAAKREEMQKAREETKMKKVETPITE